MWGCRGRFRRGDPEGGAPEGPRVPSPTGDPRSCPGAGGWARPAAGPRVGGSGCPEPPEERSGVGAGARRGTVWTRELHGCKLSPGRTSTLRIARTEGRSKPPGLASRCLPVRGAPEAWADSKCTGRGPMGDSRLNPGRRRRGWVLDLFENRPGGIGKELSVEPPKRQGAHLLEV